MVNPPMFLSLFPVLIGALVTFDRLVWREYVFHHADWQTDGQPHGFFWVPPESTLANGWLVRFDSLLASRRNSLIWLFSTPKWAREDPRALRLFVWLRILVLTWTLGLAGAFMIQVFA